MPKTRFINTINVRTIEEMDVLIDSSSRVFIFSTSVFFGGYVQINKQDAKKVSRGSFSADPDQDGLWINRNKKGELFLEPHHGHL